MGYSKVARVFESPLLCIWQFECSVHIFRGPWIKPPFIETYIRIKGLSYSGHVTLIHSNWRLFSMLNGENFTFSEEEIYKIFVRKRSNKIWRVELCGIILLGSEWFLENDGIHSCEISYCPRIEIFVHKYCSRVVPRTEKNDHKFKNSI